ncbi:MAG: hypothetical protein GY810_21820 [Aureispira sp.]|nr:hypothetical protein [Aureispira sp.]
MFEMIGQIIGMVGQMGTSIGNVAKTDRDLNSRKRDLEDYYNSDKEYWNYEEPDTENKGISKLTGAVSFGFLLLVIFLILKSVKSPKK